MFSFFFRLFYAVFNSVQVSILLFFCFFSFFHCPVILSLFFFNSLIYFFFNLISASLCLYLNIVTMGSCIHFYSISNKYFHQRTIQNRVHKFSDTYNEIRQDSVHILPNLPSPISKYPLQPTVWPPTKPQNFSTPFQGDFHNPVWPLTSTSNKISNPFQEEFTKRWPGHKPVPQILDPILGRLHRTLPISTTFPTLNPSYSPNYGSKGIWAFSRQIYHWCPGIFYSSD